MGRLRLITLNSWKGDGDYPARLTRMVDGLRPLEADLIALQEVLVAPAAGFDTAAHLAAALGLQPVVLPLRSKLRMVGGRSLDSMSGLALLTRLPVRASGRVAMPTDPADGERAALTVTLDGRDGPLTVAVLHLTHLAGAADLRRRQWHCVAAALAGAGPALAAGDFNAGIDAFLPLPPGWRDSRSTCGAAARPTVIGGGPDDCIDHVLANDIAPQAWRTVLDSPASAGSDHCGVLADFRPVSNR